MTESKRAAMSAQVIETEVAFEHSEKALKVAAFAFVSASLSHPQQSGEKL